MKRVVGIFLCLLVIAGMTGCSNNKSGISYENRVAASDVYTEIEGECSCYYGSQEDVLAMLEHGTGIVFLTWSDCPWCHKMIQYVNDAAEGAGLNVMVYDIYEDREGETKFYKQVVEVLSEELDEADAYDENGKLRIYVPDVVFVTSGKIIGHTNETSMLSGEWEDIDAAIEEYWDSYALNGQTRNYNLRKQLADWCCDVCEELEKIESRGCQACPVTKK